MPTYTITYAFAEHSGTQTTTYTSPLAIRDAMIEWEMTHIFGKKVMINEPGRKPYIRTYFRRFISATGSDGSSYESIHTIS